MYIVTGASRGIGNAVAAALAGRNLPVLAVARSQALLQELADEFPRIVTPVVADLSTPHGISDVISALGSEPLVFGIVHSAGSLIPLEPYRTIQASALVEHFRIHVAAQISLYQAVAAKSSVARMLFLDSYSASTPRDGWGAYSIIKSAAQMAARCASQELPDTVTARVFPGAVNTRIVDAVLDSNTTTADVFAELLKNGQVAEPKDVASFLATLLVDASDDLLGSRDAWDYNNHEHRTLVNATRTTM